MLCNNALFTQLAVSTPMCFDCVVYLNLVCLCLMRVQVRSVCFLSWYDNTLVFSRLPWVSSWRGSSFCSEHCYSQHQESRSIEYVLRWKNTCPWYDRSSNSQHSHPLIWCFVLHLDSILGSQLSKPRIPPPMTWLCTSSIFGVAVAVALELQLFQPCQCCLQGSTVCASKEISYFFLCLTMIINEPAEDLWAKIPRYDRLEMQMSVLQWISMLLLRVQDHDFNNPEALGWRSRQKWADQMIQCILQTSNRVCGQGPQKQCFRWGIPMWT